jgi:hypothetical protein
MPEPVADPAARAATSAAPAAPAPPATAATTPAAAAPAVATEPEKPKVKVRKPKQRSCDEKDAKGKVCAGHLKHWYDYPKDIATLVGPKSEIYRCEFCKTLYRPDPGQLSNSFTVRY